ncbi:hypothetical protein TRVL_08589 [Trypanosoma vivax]|nr:hypothetical protein TRVL_08589 [Trypanosoma vivax]
MRRFGDTTADFCVGVQEAFLFLLDVLCPLPVSSAQLASASATGLRPPLSNVRGRLNVSARFCARTEIPSDMLRSELRAHSAKFANRIFVVVSPSLMRKGTGRQQFVCAYG